MALTRIHQQILWRVACPMCLIISGSLTGQAGIAATQRAGSAAAQQDGYEIFKPHRDAAEIQMNIEQLRQQRNEMAKTLTNQHPDMVDINRRIYILQHQLELLKAHPEEKRD